MVSLESFLQSRLHSAYSQMQAGNQHLQRTAKWSTRATAIHDCNIEANKFSPITQLPNQLRCTEPALPEMDSHLVSVDLLRHVRYWHKADIGLCAAHVCFWG